jgi:hypothetical protein
MLHWLMRELDGRAWLVYLCFLNDTTHPTERGYVRQEWESALTTAHQSLEIHKAIRNYAPIFLEATTRPVCS